MRKPTISTETSPTYLPPLPSWVTIGRGETSESVSFLSGASLAILHMMLADPVNSLPAELLRNRLALRAAEACLKHEGRRDSEAEIRDAYYLTRLRDATNAIGATGSASAMGPAGEMYVRWRKASSIGLKHKDWLVRLRSSVPEQVAEKLPEWIDNAMDQGGGQGRSPVAQAAGMIALVMAAFPREEASALICGDLVLARALGWAQPVPLLGVQLKRKDLLLAAEQGAGDDLGVACHRAAAKAAQDAVRLGHDLTRRAQHLRAIAPKLRAKGSAQAVVLFLREDAVLPSTMLSPRIKGTNIPMTDRAARRLCDRLVELGVVRELTGRGTFRLYGVGA
jgi:uncharacterized protein DUF1403